MRRDDVVEVADVIAVQVREEHRVEHERQDPGGREPHAHPAPGIDEQRRAAGADQRRRACASRSGNGLPVPSSTTSIVIVGSVYSR